MDEILLIAAVILGGAVLVVALAVGAWLRTGRHRQEIAELRDNLGSALARLHELERDFKRIRSTAEAAAPKPAPEPAPRPAQPVAAPPPKVEAPAPVPKPMPPTPTPAPPPTAPTRVPEPPPAPVVESEPERPLFAPEPVASGGSNPLISWFLRGNPVAKVGVILLFFGLAFLLRFANERGLLPIELRLTGAALISTGLLVVGWRLRERRATYALTLQGGSIGALYLTSFAAFRVYSLLPHGLVFALLVVISAACVTLAVLQRSQALALLASLGGYLAPILLSTGGGNHIALFTYYAVLSAGILAISFWQAWRPLNLVGFAFTFGVGALWGVERYDPSLYAGCQFFLALNLLIYGVLTVLSSLRHAEGRSDAFVDGTLAFGTPIVAFGLQVGLTNHWEYGPAFSALAFGALYLPLARLTLRRWPERARRFTATFLALGAGFVTLAIPLALSARWTAMAWALEGVGVLWAGRAQRHTRMIWSGTGMLVLAAGSAWMAWSDHLDTPTFLMMTATLSLAWMGGAWLWRESDAAADNRVVSRVLLGGGVIAWLILIVNGSDRLTEDDASAALLGVTWMSVTALAWSAVSRRAAWDALDRCAVVLWPVAFVALYAQLLAASHPLASGWWSAAWLAAVSVEWHLLRLARNSAASRKELPVLHASVIWLIFAIVAVEVVWQLDHLGWGTHEWKAAGQLALAASFVFVVWRLVKANHWAPAAYPRTYWISALLPPLALGTVQLVVANVLDGRLPSLPYVPFFNPLEQAAAFMLLMGVVWAWRVNMLVSAPPAKVAVVALAIWWANGLLVRTLAAVGGVTWTEEALWESALIQTSVALAWTVAALVMMALAAKRANRGIWFGGAAALGLVIVKLFLVDSARTSGIARAVAFIGVALLILVIGYLAPLPPRAEREKEPVT